MTSYEFQGMLYRNADELVAATADAWLSADGHNTSDDIREALAAKTDDELARECIEGWGLDYVDPYSYDDDPKSHMEKNDYTASDLAAAFAEYRENNREVGE